VHCYRWRRDCPLCHAEFDFSIDDCTDGTDDDGDLSRIENHHRSVWDIVLLLMILLTANHYSIIALAGILLAGLSLCQQQQACLMLVMFNAQLGQVLQWLKRVFFAATIGFAIPVYLFSDRQIVANGALLCLALLGKVVIVLLWTPVALLVQDVPDAERIITNVQRSVEQEDDDANEPRNDPETTKSTRCGTA
jgi:hypothetical protein